MFKIISGPSATTDELLRSELQLAGIPTIQEAEGKGPDFMAEFLFSQSRGVKTSVLGSLHGWTFRRDWKYWECSGPGIPPEEAQALYVSHGTTVRVNGDSSCPSPLEYYKGLACGIYHVDDQAGLKALADAIKTIVEAHSI